jgi:hypothetical protein
MADDVVVIKNGFLLFKQSNHRVVTALCQEVSGDFTNGWSRPGEKLNIGFVT